MSLLSSPSTPKTYIGDRFIPCRNSDKWDIQFNINEVCDFSPLFKDPFIFKNIFCF